MLNFILETINNEKTEVKGITNYELSRGTDAACDGLRLSFFTKVSLGEVARVYAYNNKILVFNGYVDTQREKYDKNGFSIFIYARSSACLLVDNEASPITYNYPTIEALFVKNAKQFGFNNKLPKISYNDYYEISKGTSCFGTINDFVWGIVGKNIYVDPDDNIKLLDNEGDFNVDSNDLISFKKVINRLNAISTVDYKYNGDSDYNHHLKSRFIERMGINRTKKINVLSLPGWQSQIAVKSALKDSVYDYYCVEFQLSGYHSCNLCDHIVYKDENLGALSNYYICKIAFSCDKNGETTKIIGCKDIDLEAINYVA